MQDAQSGHMMDAGHVWKHSTAETDVYNVPVAKYHMLAELKCGFSYVHRPMEVQGEGDVAQIDGRLRLPYGTDVCSKDCFRLTKRFDVPDYTPQDFEIVGDPRMGPSGWVCDVAVVTDGRFDDC